MVPWWEGRDIAEHITAVVVRGEVAVLLVESMNHQRSTRDVSLAHNCENYSMNSIFYEALSSFASRVLRRLPGRELRSVPFRAKNLAENDWWLNLSHQKMSRAAPSPLRQHFNQSGQSESLASSTVVANRVPSSGSPAILAFQRGRAARRWWGATAVPFIAIEAFGFAPLVALGLVPQLLLSARLLTRTLDPASLSVSRGEITLPLSGRDYVVSSPFSSEPSTPTRCEEKKTTVASIRQQGNLIHRVGGASSCNSSCNS